jgi:UDP-N-acetylglucosamine--N-acetylmuramyl-(pentapeptide) pyrophosphoryl-undecaprenol N-acetylglucosamine transferase
MSFLIAAAGTGGHVFPGLAVGEGLLELGLARDDIVYVGGDRLEANVYPDEGFPFVGVELAGLQRSLSLKNLRIPAVVLRARTEIGREIDESGVRVVLGMGGYVTIPAGLAARSRRLPFFIAEQNAEAGLANQVAARWARESFVSFPDTHGLDRGTWVGHPVRRPFWDFDRAGLRTEALDRYGLEGGTPVLGVFGGSLGARAINDAVAAMVARWEGPSIQVLHLTGREHLMEMSARRDEAIVDWVQLGFESRMDLFYAACDLVVARAGGAVAELTATATPAILVPGSFGSGGHQEGNARALEEAGAARIVWEGDLERLHQMVADIIGDDEARVRMARGATDISKPRAALSIAAKMIEAAR